MPQEKDTLTTANRSIGCGMIAVALLMSACAQTAAIKADGLADREVASVKVGTDGILQVREKLGDGQCRSVSDHGDSTSYFYHALDGEAGRQYLEVDVGDQGDRIDAITVSKHPPVTGVCYAPVHAAARINTGKGIHLGATEGEIIGLYGNPVQQFRLGSLARFRFERKLERSYEWDLIFRDGRLVEWHVHRSES
jgi:hypothetical protein